MKEKIVPVNDPQHPAHKIWLEALRAILTIAPIVIQVADPKDAVMAQTLGSAGLRVMDEPKVSNP